jgi:hypothetical protein
MKKIILFLVSLSFVSVLNAEPTTAKQDIVIINNTAIDFNNVENLSESPFVIQEGGFDAMISGDSQLLISTKKWTDEQMADYKQRHASLPVMLIIAGYSDLNEATPSEIADVFSKRAGNELLYFYVSQLKLKDTREAIVLHFSETLQPWFDDNGLMPAPESIQNQNRVELGLAEPMFANGYK